jgi:hypothetical protein
MTTHRPLAATVPGARPKAPAPTRGETHSERLERLADEADGVTTGEDLGGLSREERRKRLFGR